MSDDPVDIRPTLADVGSLLRARTRSDATGTETGTFSASTRPTGDEVTGFIDQVIPDVRLRLPDDLTDDLEPFATTLVARRAAMLVELSYDPDRSSEDGSAYERLRELYDSGLEALLSALEDRGTDATTKGRVVVVDLTSPYSAPVITDPLTAIALDQE